MNNKDVNTIEGNIEPELVKRVIIMAYATRYMLGKTMVQVRCEKEGKLRAKVLSESDLCALKTKVDDWWKKQSVQRLRILGVLYHLH